MKHLHALDKKGTTRLSRADFKRGLQEGGVAVNDKDQEALFTYFDATADNTVSIDDFAQAFRKPLNDHRRHIVEAAYTALDQHGKRVVDVEVVKEMYDAFKNPEVVGGKKTADQAYREFLEHFNICGGGGGMGNNVVTLEDFITYYEDLGVSVESDEYFELVSDKEGGREGSMDE